MTLALHNANADNAEEVARIISQSSDGVVSHLLDGLIKGFSGETLLSTALMQGNPPYCLENVSLVTRGGGLVGLLFAYPATEHKISLIIRNFVPSRRLNSVRPILETAIPGSLYINTLWVEETQRSKGLGATLIEYAAALAKKQQIARLSLFCWNDNEQALRFYAREGFTIETHLPEELLPLEGHSKGGSILCKRLGIEA